MLSIICAMAKNRVIGYQNRLPWHLPEDLKHFKKTTMGHPILMGRKTYQSIGRPLPGRDNIVLTRDETFQAEGITVVSDLASALEITADHDPFVIGGATLYEEALPHTKRLYLTLIDQDFTGDCYFPDFDLEDDFRIVSESPLQHSEKEKLPYRFIVANRR